MNACPDCEGTGTIKDSWLMDTSGNLIEHDEKCDTCGGSGFVQVEEGVPEVDE